MLEFSKSRKHSSTLPVAILPRFLNNLKEIEIRPRAETVESILPHLLCYNQIFNLETFQVEDELAAPLKVNLSALSPDGEWLAWALEDYTIRLARLADHAEIGVFEGHFDLISGIIHCKLLTAKENTLGLGMLELVFVFALCLLLIGVPIGIMIGVGWLRRNATNLDKEGRVPCPYCAELILPNAKVCRFCGRDLASDR